MHQKIYLCTYIFIQTVIFNFDPSGILKFFTDLFADGDYKDIIFLANKYFL